MKHCNRCAHRLVTPDISPVVTEITTMPGWRAGSPLTLILTQVSGTGVRWVESSEDLGGVATPALILTVADDGRPVTPLMPTQGTSQVVSSVSGRPDGSEETTSTGAMYLTSSDYEFCADGHEQVVLIRFPSVDIQPNAVIEQCRVLFKVDEIRPGQSDVEVQVQIFGDANPNPTPVVDTAHDISSRRRTSAAVNWAPEPSVNAGDPLVTSDIGSIVTEIISMPGWRAGNPLALIFARASGEGVRWAESSESDRNGVMTPALVTTVRYGPPLPLPPAPPRGDDIVITNTADGCAEENADTGAMYLTSSDLEFCADGDNLQIVGIRFPSVPVSASARLHQCKLLFDIDEIRPGQSDQRVRVHIVGEASVDSAPFADSPFDISGRAATEAGVNWWVPLCDPDKGCNEHDALRSPNIKHIVEEIIGMPGWQPGNPMTFMITHMAGSGVRWVESHRVNNGVHTPALVLTNVIDSSVPLPPPAIGISTHLVATTSGRPDGGEENANDGSMYLTSSDYEFSTDGDHVQLVGIRFPSVDIDAQAHVTEAHILFDVDEVQPGLSDTPITVAIHGEASVNSGVISDTPRDISSRPTTAASVTWSPESSTEAHANLITPDVSQIVTEVIGMGGWSSGNPMTFIFTKVEGDGCRWAESSRENNGIMTPALLIDYSVDGGGPPAGGSCTAANVAQRSSAVTASCCADGSCAGSSTGFPAACGPTCARTFVPFWSSCSGFMQTTPELLQQFQTFAQQCMAMLPSARSCQVAQLTQLCGDMAGVAITEICDSPCLVSAMAQWSNCNEDPAGAALVAEMTPFVTMCQAMGGGGH